jgi:murein DD-endopeptidase MepM/ murein hydrolase activator NlpD
MGENINLRRGLAAAASLSVIAGLLSACSPGPGEPAPVYLRSAPPTAAKASPPPPPWRDTVFTVRQGDTVIDIAHDYHVPLGTLIAANKLRSPYLIRPGDRIVIPDGGVLLAGGPTAQQAMAAPPPGAPPIIPPQMAAIPPRPAPTTLQVATATLPLVGAAAQPSAPIQAAATTPQVAAIAPQAVTSAQSAMALPRPATPPSTVAVIPLPQPPSPPPIATAAAPIPSPPPIMAAAAPIPSPSPPPSPPTATKNATDVMSPDPPPKQLAAIGPLPPAIAPPATTSNGVPSVLAARNPAAALPLPGEAAPAVALGTPVGRFLWPVHGRILASYGLSNGEAHNQGINIAVPIGTLVRSIDAGTVAYAGNEVKGYGNLVLIKHASGWISAYAHLNDITVKKGDPVSAGEVIAKVGDTGGVGEPQLHFELRRGNKPVDPKEFLEPAGSAAARATQKAG